MSMVCTMLVLILLSMNSLCATATTAARANNTSQESRCVDPRQFESVISSLKTELKAQLESQRREMQQQFQLMFELLNASSSSRSLLRSRRSVELDPLPRDCSDLLASNESTSGVYTVFVGRLQRPVQVYCDMKTDGGGWTLIQRRQDGKENFSRHWNDYANGFGDVDAEFWLGNDAIHWMTSGRNYRLRFDLRDWYGNSRHAEYSNFKVGSECEKYRLRSVGEYCGTAGDSFTYHLDQKFSALDQDNDSFRSGHCAQLYNGGWWYKSCHLTNPNGLYLRGPYTAPIGIGLNWNHWTGTRYSLKVVEMKIRPNDM